MNGKPDEHLDQWVRQSLDRLPDTLPPGTTFNHERLWTQLRPELQKPARSRQRGWWWVAAACLAGVGLGWFVLDQPQLVHSAAVTHEKRPALPQPNDQPSSPVIDPGQVARVVPETSRPPVERRVVQATATPVSLGNESTQVVALPDESSADTRIDSIASAVSDKASVSVVRSPKRRFQVVHLNELQAEEDIRPSQYRTERFVRLGMGSTGASSPQATHPSISLPINTKSNL
jgi:hypothetical protein